MNDINQVIICFICHLSRFPPCRWMHQNVGYWGRKGREWVLKYMLIKTHCMSCFRKSHHPTEGRSDLSTAILAWWQPQPKKWNRGFNMVLCLKKVRGNFVEASWRSTLWHEAKISLFAQESCSPFYKIAMQILMPQLILGRLIFSALTRFYLFIFCLFSQIAHDIQVEMHKKNGESR